MFISDCLCKILRNVPQLSKCVLYLDVSLVNVDEFEAKEEIWSPSWISVTLVITFETDNLRGLTLALLKDF